LMLPKKTIPFEQQTLEDSGSSTDTLQLFYQVDNDPEVEGLSILGENYTSPVEISFAAGSKLALRITGETSSGTEAYDIQNLTVSETL